MTTTVVEQLYQSHVKSLTHAEQLHLVVLITSALAQDAAKETTGKHNILELEGVGAEIWQGVDAQEYINQLRDEWDKGAA